MSRRLTPKESLFTIIEKIGIENFENLSIDLLEYKKTGKVVFDISLIRATLGGTTEVFETLSKKYKIERSDVRKTLDALVYLFREILTTSRNKLVENFKQNEKIADKADILVKIGDELLQKFPEIRGRFYVTTFCKTNYLGDIDWEIILKVVEHPVYGFEKRERFPVCVLRFLLERPISLLRPLILGERTREVVFEASINDIDKIIENLSNIRDKMKEIEKEMITEEIK